MSDYSEFFKVGGALDDDAPSYITRSADDELIVALEQNELCLVLAPRQMGKSSLIVRAWKRLKELDIAAGIVDLQFLGSERDENRWFSDVVFQIGQSLDLEIDTYDWWEKQKHGSVQRFVVFLENVVLKECRGRVVIFFDEVDSALDVPFSDDFFTSVRSLYNSRATRPKLRNLTFVFVGVTTASSFVKKTSRTPFNIGKSINLSDFSLESIKLIEQELGTGSASLVERIFYWTNGQPYLVQRLAAAAASWPPEKRTSRRLDKEVKKSFLECEIEQDIHLKFIRDYLLDSTNPVHEILTEYQNVLEGHEVLVVENSPIHNRLKLSGIVRFANKRILSRNRIYEVVFNLKWVEENKPIAEISKLEKVILKALKDNETQVDISNFQLDEIPLSIAQLPHLEILNANSNKIRFLPKEIEKISSLTELSINKNFLEALPNAVGRLKNLTSLNASDNLINTIPESIGFLTKLLAVDFHNNRLTRLPDNIGKLTELQFLDLRDNQLEILPKSIKELVNLKVLLLHGNERLSIPNKLLGPTFEELSNGAIPSNPQDILNYYFLTQSDWRPLNEAKLTVVGFGNVGKTSLVNRLIYNTFDFNNRKTEGLQITQWNLRLHNIEEIKLHVWDFGGQEIMHSTHQFFLTERSLYILVLNGRQGHEDTDAEYWLELIQSFGGSSPVIVVLNKVKDQPFDVNRSALKQKFPNIRGFIQTDFEANIGTDQLRAVIERETDRLEHLRETFPARWFEIKNRLMSMTKSYIPFEQYRTICREDGESDYGAQNSLAVHLHNLGIALNFRDDPRLRDTHVLNPRWVTNGIYTILNAHALATSKGELKVASLAKVLNPIDYPQESHGFLLELMRKFELCFRFQEDENRYLIPDLLDKQQAPAAEEFKPEECLNFRYEYPILPEGLLPRFIVRTHVLSTNQLRWRTGVILEFEGNQALVKADRHDRCVTINVNGPISGRNRLLAIIRADFERIHCSFKFKSNEQVPVPAYPEVLLNYQDLVVMEREGLKDFHQVINGKVIRLNVQDLLRGVDLDDAHRKKPESGLQTQPLHLFYSYSHQDEALRDQLEVRLKLMQRNNLIQSWHDRRIVPGADWQHEPDAKLEQADIILLLVSPDFIASDYCYEVEMKRAVARHDAQEATVIPILLRPVDWNSVPFSHIQALPRDLKPVTQWADPDNAWLDVEQGIKNVIEEKMNR